MKYRLKRLFNIKNGYLIGMILMISFVCLTTFSYALFTASTEREGALNIVSGNLFSLITSKSFNEQKQVTVDPKSSKTFEVKLTNVNGIDAKFNFYYTTTHDNIDIGYIKDKDTPPTEAGVMLKQNSMSGDSKTYLIQINNKDELNPVTVTFGSDVGLSNKPLNFPSDKHILNEIKITDLYELPITEENDYNKASDEEKHKMFKFIHKNEETEEITTDYRYIGKDPYNYLMFENDTTNTKWRIVGVFNDSNTRVKIVKDESIGNYAWDTNGKNNWNEPTSIKTLLNEGEYFNTLPDIIKNKIEERTWYLNGLDNTSYNTDQIFIKERENKDEQVNFTGKIGLLYLSDYGYSFSKGINDLCFNNIFDENKCKDYKDNTWMYTDDNTNEWTITPNKLTDNEVLNINKNGNIISSNTKDSLYSVRPAMYLNSNITIINGNGTKDNPYIIR